MRLILIVLLTCSFAFPSYLQESANVERDVLNGKLHERAVKAIDAVIKLLSVELRKRGYKDKSERLDFEWNEVHRWTYEEYVSGKRDIGDHPTQLLNQWIEEQVVMAEMVLGVSFCKTAHISDLRVLNATPRIVFRPCSFEMDHVQGERIDEYRRHFSRGSVYFGLVPVVTYWGSYIGCGFASAGTGFVYACGLVGELAENLMGHFVTDRLSNVIYKKACGE